MTYEWMLPAALEVLDHKKVLAGTWDKLAEFLLGKKMSLGFTGMPGVGKTVLVDHLTGRAYAAGYQPRGESKTGERDLIRTRGEDRTRIRLTVVPGQDSPQRHESLDSLFSDETPVDGIIHVVSNGFTDIRNAVAREVLVETGGLASVETFRQAQLARELDDLRRTCDKLRDSLRRNHKPTWLLVAVDKVDLYQDSLLAAQRYYSPETESAFSAVLTELRHDVGRDRFTWQAVPVCGWLEDFHWNGQIVKSTLKPNERDHYVGQFVRELERFCGGR